MRLKQLIERLTVKKIEGPLDREITGLAYDSRRVSPGMLFVAIAGQNVDGHDYIASAIDRGAVAVICEHNDWVRQRATKIEVPNAREALAQTALTFHDHPSARLQVIGVAGTHGKTTVSFLVKQMLEAAGIKAGLIGTIRYEIGERMIPAQRTTPEALEIQQMMAQMLRADCQACVMEVSWRALEQQRICGVDFDVAIFTNLSRDHLEYHVTREGYFQDKKRLCTDWPPGSKRAGTVINIDDEFGERFWRETQAEVKLTYGLDESATIRASHIQLGKEGSRMEVQMPGAQFSCCLPLIGRHNIYNALAAIGAGAALRIPPVDMASALGSMPPVPGRLEKVSAGQSFDVFVDYAHTDDALQNVLTTLREITGGRLLLAFGCGGSRETGKRPKMGKVAAALADFTLITSDNPRRESPASIAAQIEEGFGSVRKAGYQVELDRRKAIEKIIRLARPGDSVLIAGKGHETYQEFEDTVVPFDDRVYAQETLETLGYAWEGIELASR